MSDDLSRRDALLGGVALSAVALATTLRPREANAQPMQDVMTLNALLTAEYQAVKAYDAGAMILMAPPMGDPLATAAPTVLAVAANFRQQHRDHAARLAQVITGMNGTPVAEASVMFTAPMGFTASVTNVIKLGANAEKAAAVAYAEALKVVSSQTAAEVVAAIGGVETQHFIVLHLLLKGVATPGPAAMTMITEVSPRPVVAIEGEAADLSTVPDFTYAPLAMM